MCKIAGNIESQTCRTIQLLGAALDSDGCPRELHHPTVLDPPTELVRLTQLSMPHPSQSDLSLSR